MGKILFIAYTFPPIPYGGTYRALRLCRGFADKGFECHVVTLKEYSDIPNDYELLAKVPESVNIHRVPIIDPWRRYQRFKKRYADRSWFRIVNKFVSLLLRPITFPDHMLFWVPFAAVKARQVIKQHDIETVLVSSPPDSSQLVGWILKRTCKVRWVADFRDPIYGNVAQVNMIDPKSILDRFQKKMLYRFDRFVTCNADVLIANTETHAEWLGVEHGLENVHTVRNSFDPVDFTNHDNENRFDEFTIAHVGSIYGKRNPDLLFAAVKQLADDYAPEPLNLKLIFLGSGGDSLKGAIEKYGIGDYVSILDQVPHEKAIEVMRRSHLLLLIKATGKWSRGQIPGKFFEYLGTRNPVLCLGPENSEVSEIISKNSLGFVVEDSHEDMLRILREQYRHYCATGTIARLPEKQVDQFSSSVMVEKLYTALDSE